MAETPPGLDNLKLWLRMNEYIGEENNDVINEVGDNGNYRNYPEEWEGEFPSPSISSGDPPYLNGALRFGYHGDNDQYIDFGAYAATKLTSIDFSINLWCKLASTASQGFCTHGRYAHSGWDLVLYTNKIYVQYNKSGGVYRTASPAALLSTDGTTWNMLTFVGNRNGDSKGEIFVDGTEIANYDTQAILQVPDTTTYNLHIGADYAGGSTIQGRLDNIMIFNKALTQNEINWLYNGGNGRENPYIARPLVGGSLAGNSLIGRGSAR